MMEDLMKHLILAFAVCCAIGTGVAGAIVVSAPAQAGPFQSDAGWQATATKVTFIACGPAKF
jgi:hypothetical protein